MLNKPKIIAACLSLLQEKLDTLDVELAQIQQSANEETKSSAGDKYETGRAMLMLEKEKLSGQKAQFFQQVQVLKSIDEKKVCVKVEYGAVVRTNTATYFIASGLGMVKVDNQELIVVSALAPIIQVMLDKIVGDSFEFNRVKGEVLEIY